MSRSSASGVGTGLASVTPSGTGGWRKAGCVQSSTTSCHGSSAAKPGVRSRKAETQSFFVFENFGFARTSQRQRRQLREEHVPARPLMRAQGGKTVHLVAGQCGEKAGQRQLAMSTDQWLGKEIIHLAYQTPCWPPANAGKQADPGSVSDRNRAYPKLRPGNHPSPPAQLAHDDQPAMQADALWF